MNEVCGDNRFEIIAKAKKAILDGTNIDTDEDEMKVLDNILFRCWQMKWLDKYDDTKKTDRWIPVSERLPKEDSRCLVTYPIDGDFLWVETMYYGNIDGDKKCFYCSDDEWGDVEYDDVIAWTPLPEPYNGER